MCTLRDGSKVNYKIQVDAGQCSYYSCPAYGYAPQKTDPLLKFQEYQIKTKEKRVCNVKSPKTDSFLFSKDHYSDRVD